MMTSESVDDVETDRGDITIIGSVHLSEEYFDHVRDVIATEQPDVVAVELDAARLDGLFDDSATQLSLTDIFSEFSVRAGVLYAILAYSQRRLAQSLGIDPSMNDMRVATKEAARQESQLALIDRNINSTLERMSENVTLPTIWRVWRRTRTIDDEKIPDDIADQVFELDNFNALVEYRDLLDELAPEFTEAFIHERDQYMAKRIYALEEAGYDTVAVIGGAHEPGVRDELDRLRDGDPENVPGLQLRRPVLAGNTST